MLKKFAELLASRRYTLECFNGQGKKEEEEEEEESKGERGCRLALSSMGDLGGERRRVKLQYIGGHQSIRGGLDVEWTLRLPLEPKLGLIFFLPHHR